jgi:acetyl esterase/lipase
MNTIFIILLILVSKLSIAQTVQYDLSYGDHERNTFDLWIPEALSPTPLVIYIHGGGFQVGDKDEIRKNYQYVVERYLKAGIAFAAINYRFLKHTSLQNIMKEDIAGFIQYMRFHAKKYNLKKEDIFSYGFSAGGSASLWVATHDEVADLDNFDLQKRESSRIKAAGHMNAQVSYDYTIWYEIFGKELTDKYIGSHVWSRYHLNSYEDIFTPVGIEIRQTLNMIGNMSPDDPPLLFWNSLEDDVDRDNNHFVHSPIHSRELAKKAHLLGIPFEKWVKADGDMNHNNAHGTFYNFVIKNLN